ncbi:MAG: DNA translocase FtsK 4TM domain-containing protein [Desulfobacterium sp.]|nr:DNA translocase FtsK 4TM domain-containing protein [Desulfobacterium sp.]
MKKEITGILFAFLVVLTTISLVSYSPVDPSVNTRMFAAHNHIQNSFGLVGAHLSGLLVALFGLGSFWVPVLMLLCSAWYFRGRSNRIIGMTLGGGILLVISTGSMLTLFQESYSLWGRDYSSGGLLGIPFASFLLEYANPIGCIIILLVLFVIGFVLTTGISMVTVLRFVKGGFLRFGRFVAKQVTTLAGQGKQMVGLWKEHRKKRARTIEIKPLEPEKQKKRFKKRTSPKKMLDIAIQAEPVITQIEPPAPARNAPGQARDLRERSGFQLPPVSLLNDKKVSKQSVNIELLRKKGEILERKLTDFGVSGEVVEILPGPVITTFEYRPAKGVKISKIVNLTDDLALALSALSIRIIAPIPGKDVVGVEIPNEKREFVSLRDILVSTSFVDSPSKLTMALGKDIVGIPIAAAMDRMPHLLIAGATGTGKSVGLNAMIISLLYKATPEEVKFIMVDPKRIELSVYDGIPHLISPVVTDMKKATNALFWAVREMERRYELLAKNGVRNLLQYNELADKGGTKDTEEGEAEKLPYIVVIVDEFADLMMVASKDVESALIRLAQMARAAGIHLILATQRPSVDVLTGIIKANFPTRISFQVSSKIDSRTILDANGSERLLGNGDMLFLPPGTGRLQRIQGAYISEAEIARITGYLKEQQAPQYVEDVTERAADAEGENEETEYDEKYDEAVALVTKNRQASISSVQRHLRIGYNRAARIIEVMEKEGIIGPQEGAKQREVLVKDHGN